MRNLTEQQKEFLKNYHPKMSNCTSAEEVLLITEELQLIEAEQQDVDFAEYRDQIISYYDEISEDSMDYIDSLTSVLSVMSIFVYGIKH